MTFEFLKERYDFELDRKETLTGALTLPVGVLSVLGGSMAAMGRSFSYTSPLVSTLFLSFLIPAAASFFVCAYHLWRAYLAQTYIYLPLLAELQEWEEEDRHFRAYVEANGGRPVDDESFEWSMRQRIISAADTNTKSNDRRSKWMHWSRIWLFAVFCFTALTGISYVADQARF
jgi:hypothetical protein